LPLSILMFVFQIHQWFWNSEESAFSWVFLRQEIRWTQCLYIQPYKITGSSNWRRRLWERNALFVTDFCRQYMIVFLTHNNFYSWSLVPSDNQNSLYRSSINFRQTLEVPLCDQKMCVVCHYCYTNIRIHIF
jgi:hypothetical protein